MAIVILSCKVMKILLIVVLFLLSQKAKPGLVTLDMLGHNSLARINHES